jgi:hypothetical protein
MFNGQPEHLGTSYITSSGAKFREFSFTPFQFTGGMPISMSHPFNRVLGYRDSGGPWAMWHIKQTVTPSEPLSVYSWANEHPFYKGRFSALRHVNSTWSPPQTFSNEAAVIQHDNLWGVGATAWDRMRPAKPSFDLAQNLLELKDLPSGLKGDVRRIRDEVKQRHGRANLSRTAEWHLSTQFGWLPTLNAYRDFMRALKEMDARFKQLLRDNGRPIRRKTVLFEDESSDTYMQSFQGFNPDMYPALDSRCYAGNGYSYTTTTFREKIWGSARFRYYLPPGPRDLDWYKKVGYRMFGFQPTPSLIYNLTPWTWLIDYFTNLGDLYDNLSRGVEDRLIAEYFYLMHERTWKSVTDASQWVYVDEQRTQPKLITARIETVWTIKARTVGSPFGVGVRYDDLTANQLSILSALGISRSKGNFRNG